MNGDHTFDDVLVNAITRVIDKKLPEIAQAVRPRMMSLRQARAYLDVSDSTIRQMITDGRLKRTAQYTEGGAIYIERDELDRFIEERMKKGLQ